MRALAALVLKDLKLFFGDRRAVVITLVTPILIASFFGFITSGRGDSEAAKISVLLVDQDTSAISKKIAAGLSADTALEVTAASSPEIAREKVRKGKAAVGVIIPAGFGDASALAFFGGVKPEIALLYDPSRLAELAMVRGMLTQHVMESVSQEAFSGTSGKKATADALASLDQNSGIATGDKDVLRNLLQSVDKWRERQEAAKSEGQALVGGGGLSVPYTMKEEAVTAHKGIAYNGYAHSFAGMAVQFILFSAIELGMGILLERERGLWKRLRAAPVRRSALLLGKGLSGTLLALMILSTSFGFAMVVFKVRVLGSWPGFLLLCLASSLMAAAFGLMLAAVGRTTGATRGLSILAVLLMVMLGGGWVPAFLFPGWMQKAALLIPTSWSLNGLDGVTWRGVGLMGTLPAVGALMGFALLFSAVAIWRFRWDEA